MSDNRKSTHSHSHKSSHTHVEKAPHKPQGKSHHHPSAEESVSKEWAVEAIEQAAKKHENPRHSRGR